MDISTASGNLSRQSLLALIWTAFSVALLFVILHSAIRFRNASRFAVEDYWIFLALAALLTNSVLQTVQLPSLYYMSGIISGEFPPSSSAQLIAIGDEYLRYEFIIIGLFWTVLWCVKGSFLAVYFKLFQGMPRYRIVWYVVAVLTFCAYIGCWVTAINSCHPVGNFFKFAECETPDDVWGSRMSVYYSTVVDIFTDLCIMAMPIKLIYNIKISVKQKAGLVCVFSLCLVVIVFAITRANQSLTQEYFVNLILLEIWSTLESSISVVVGCLPAFKSLIASRASKQRSNNGSFSGGSKQRVNGQSRTREGSVPLGSFSKDTKSANRRYPDASDSQEAIVKPNDSNAIMVKSDVSVEYVETDSLPPVYSRHQMVPNDGRHF